ncbi:MAG: helix-turn-helix domain-containing protein [Mycobacteriales bacterium]
MAVKRKRLAERRKTLGHSQESLAEQLGVDRSTVVRWERGETQPQPHVRPRLAELLAVAPGELDTLLENDPPSTVDLYSLGGVGWDRERVVRAVEEPRRVDREVVRYLEQAIDVTSRASRTMPPTELIAAVTPAYALLRRLRREAPPEVREPLLGLVSRCEQFIGRMYYEAGDLRQALSWSDRALASAHQAGDGQLVAYTLMRRASLVGAQGDHSQAIDLARAGRAAARDLPAHLMSLSLRHEAEGYAKAGELSQCLGALEASAEFLERGVGTEGPAYAKGFSRGFQRVRVAGCYVELGRYEDAIGIYRDELPAWPASREAAYHLAVMARACAAEGYGDLAKRSAGEAGELARRTGAARALRVLAALGG